VNGATVHKWDDVRNAIRSSPGRTIALGVESSNGPRRVDITPFPDKEDGHTVGIIGVYPRFSVKRLGPLGALTSSARAEADLVTGFFQKVPQAFSPRTLGLTGGQGPSPNRPFSIIGAGRIAVGLARQGQIAIFLLLFVQINVFVGLFNLMPLPPLDGGHLLVLAIEKIRRRPVDQRALMPVMAVVLSLLALLMVLLIYYDITSPVQLPVR
jgi:RIP metalloprotease RseP